MTIFSGKSTNPIAEARLNAGYSAASLGKRLKLSKQYISRAEHGTYRSVNVDLLRWAASQLSVNIQTVLREYRRFQTLVRDNTVRNVKPEYLHRGESRMNGHAIFELWRSCYWDSVTSFSNAFCVHPEMVRAYEEGIRDEMPSELREILNAYNLIDPDWTERPQIVTEIGPGHGSPVRPSKASA